MEFLDEAWCEALVARAATARTRLVDVTAEIQLTGAPRGLGRISLVIQDGRVATVTPEPNKDAELKLKSSHEDVSAMLMGERDPAVAFMTGDLKTDGPTGPLLTLLAAWNKPETQRARAELAALTAESATSGT